MDDMWVGLSPILTPKHYGDSLWLLKENPKSPVVVHFYRWAEYATLHVCTSKDMRYSRPFYCVSINITGEVGHSTSWYDANELISLGCTFEEFVKNPFYYFDNIGLYYAFHPKEYCGWSGERLYAGLNFYV